jgi:hypothetical protein
MSARSPEALEAALAVLRRPQLARLAQRSALPRGVTLLLEVAAGEPDALIEAQAITGRPEPLLRKAAGFFMEQVLLSRKSDSYRILGASSSASASELRRHLALILKWLHPDRLPPSGDGPHLDRSALVNLVTGAWETVKTGERRTAYDAARMAQLNHGRKATSRSRRGAPAASGSRFLARRPRRTKLALYKFEPESFWTRLLSYLGRLR